MKRLYLLLIAVFICAGAIAQPYENSWIDYSQQYYKIKVWQDGIFRISRNALFGASIPITSHDPRNIQLFHNGVEQYIYVNGESDGVFDANDYIHKSY